MIQSIINLFNNKSEKVEAPEGVCPNCWGRQEYSGKFYEAVKNEGIDVNNASEKIGWIQDYADKHLSGIKMEKTTEGYVCPKCKVTYKT